MYADDVTMLAWDHNTSQQLWDFSLFCLLFDMTVILTHVVVFVFRQPGGASPTTLLFRGKLH
jgi:hypothetical protein